MNVIWAAGDIIVGTKVITKVRREVWIIGYLSWLDTNNYALISIMNGEVVKFESKIAMAVYLSANGYVPIYKEIV